MTKMTEKHSLDVYRTRTEAVNHMVEMGVPRNLAKAVVNEQYNHEDDGDTRDLLFEMNDNGPVILNCVTNNDLFMTWTTFEEGLTDDDKGIYIDGELLYDIEGNHL